jgi:hypothetical protein
MPRGVTLPQPFALNPILLLGANLYDLPRFGGVFL